MCETFHGLAPADRPTVDHINRNKLDNRPENLRWASYSMQNYNRQVCLDSLARYGVRRCEYARAHGKAYYAEHREQILARNAAYAAKQKALGRHERKCPDGKRHWLTDEEFAARYG